MASFTKTEKTIIKIILILDIGYLGYTAIKNKDRQKVFICKNTKTKKLYYCDKMEKVINKLDNLKIKKWY